MSRLADAHAAESRATSSGLTSLTASSFTNARPSLQGPSASGLRRPSLAYALSRQPVADKAKASSAPDSVTPTSHPERFTPDGQLKWKTPPPGVAAEPNKTGSGHWVERWKSPSTGEWVYNYTAAFMQQQALKKFAKNAEFGKKLPEVLQQVRADLEKPGRDRVLACAVDCIHEAYFRIGNEQSAQDRGHYGLTTVEARHLHFEDEKAIFEFVGKSGQQQRKVVSDPATVGVLRELKAACEKDSDRLFRFGTEAIQNADVNAYLDRFDVTAKQFRTYHATRLCREQLLALGSVAEKDRENAVTEVVKNVAEELGHTPAVCRASYIDPVVIEAFLEGKLK